MLIGDPGPLSQDTSTCLRTGLEWVDLRELMTEDTRERGQDDRAGAVLLSVIFHRRSLSEPGGMGTLPLPTWD